MHQKGLREAALQQQVAVGEQQQSAAHQNSHYNCKNCVYDFSTTNPTTMAYHNTFKYLAPMVDTTAGPHCYTTPEQEAKAYYVVIADTRLNHYKQPNYQIVKLRDDADQTPPKSVASHLGSISHIGTNAPKFAPSLRMTAIGLCHCGHRTSMGGTTELVPYKEKLHPTWPKFLT